MHAVPGEPCPYRPWDRHIRSGPSAPGIRDGTERWILSRDLGDLSESWSYAGKYVTEGRSDSLCADCDGDNHDTGNKRIFQGNRATAIAYQSQLAPDGHDRLLLQG